MALEHADDALPLWFRWRLGGMLPDPVKTQLLRSFLERGEVARTAWNDFARTVGNPKSFFEDDFVGLKALLPVIERGFEQNGIDPGQQFLTYARVAMVREELRDRIYREVFESTLALLEPAVSDPLVLRGLALAETAYPDPARRHNHGIDLLLPAGCLPGASRVLDGAGYPLEERDFAETRRTHRHRSGLPVTLHTRLFEMPFLEDPIGLGNRRARFDTGERTPATLSPADHLLHVCGRAAYSRTRANLRWVCDAVLLVRSQTDFDWQRFADTSVESGLALPMAVAMEYLRDHFEVAVPADCPSVLYRRCALNRPRERSALQSIALECPPAAGRPPRKLPVASRMRLLGFRSMPSTAYMRWKYGASGTGSLVNSYLRRGLGFLHRRARLYSGVAAR